MRKNYHAFTGITNPYPAYISVNQEEDFKISVTVRGEGSETASTIYMTAEQAEQLATDMLDKLNGGA
jgi:tartrate dehydratase alpha subunit/fumarate hydratase class I-like protein